MIYIYIICALFNQPADSDISCCPNFIPSSAAAAAPATACSDISWRPQPAAGYDPGRDSAPKISTSLSHLMLDGAKSSNKLGNPENGLFISWNIPSRSR